MVSQLKKSGGLNNPSLGLGIGLGFGIVNLKNILKYLIGGVAGTVDIPVRQMPVQ